MSPFNEDSGSAYVFVHNGTNWTQQAKLTASFPAAGDRFGFSVALSDDTAVVGAFLGDDASVDAGAAHVFVRNGTSWSEQARLFASDGVFLDLFGWRDRGERLHALSREGRWDAMPDVVDDEMLETFVPTARYAEIPTLLRDWYGEFTDWITFPMPTDPQRDPDAAKTIATLQE